MEGTYYLHRETKQLIFKHPHYEYEGDLVERIWPVDTQDRKTAWTIILESAALGARESDLVRLSDHWGLNLEDLSIAITQLTPTPILKRGLIRWAKVVLKLEESELFEKLGSFANRANTK